MSARANASSSETKFSVVYNLLPNGAISGTHLAPVYNIVSIQSFSPIVLTELPGIMTGQPSHVNFQESHMVTCILVILGVLFVIAIIVSLAVYVVKRNKFDRIRHHLMPLYNFDPTDDEPHWEADLLEDDRDQQMVLNITSSTNQPKLKFHSHDLDI